MQGNDGFRIRARLYARIDSHWEMARGPTAKVFLVPDKGPDFRWLSNRNIPLPNLWIPRILRQNPVRGAMIWSNQITLGDARNSHHPLSAGQPTADRPTSAAVTAPLRRLRMIVEC